MSKPQLLIIVTRPDLAGVQVHITEIIKGLSDQYCITIATGSKGYLSKYADSRSIKTIIVPTLVRQLSPHRDVRAFLQLKRIIQSFKFDLVHAHSSKAGILSRLAARSCGVPCVFTAHGWAFSDGVPLLHKLIGLILEKVCAAITTHTIVVSKADAKIAKHYRILKPGRYSVIHNGISDLSEKQKQANSKDGPFTAIMVARCCQQKDYASLIECYARYPDLGELTLIGDGPMISQVKQLISQHRLTDRVTMLGEVTSIATHLEQCNLFILASRWEGLPMSILEALRSSMPVVATDVGGVSEAVIDGVNGYLFPRGDIDRLASCIRLIKSNHKLYSDMASKSRDMFEKNFTASQMLEKVDQIYRNAISDINK